MLESLEGNVKVGIREEPRITEQVSPHHTHTLLLITM